MVVALLGPNRRVLSPLCLASSRSRVGVMLTLAYQVGGAVQIWQQVLKVLDAEYRRGLLSRDAMILVLPLEGTSPPAAVPRVRQNNVIKAQVV